MSANTLFAIRNGIRTGHKCIAIAEVWTYEVWGNARDGFEVNDRSCVDRHARFVCPMEVSNVPAHPGAKDDYRQFPDSGSFSADLVVSFFPTDKDIAGAFGLTAGKIETDGDDLHIYVNLKCNGRPIGEIIIDSWEPFTD